MASSGSLTAAGCLDLRPHAAPKLWLSDKSGQGRIRAPAKVRICGETGAGMVSYVAMAGRVRGSQIQSSSLCLCASLRPSPTNTPPSPRDSAQAAPAPTGCLPPCLATSATRPQGRLSMDDAVSFPLVPVSRHARVTQSKELGSENLKMGAGEEVSIARGLARRTRFGFVPRGGVHGASSPRRLPICSDLDGNATL